MGSACSSSLHSVTIAFASTCERAGSSSSARASLLSASSRLRLPDAGAAGLLVTGCRRDRPLSGASSESDGASSEPDVALAVASADDRPAPAGLLDAWISPSGEVLRRASEGGWELDAFLTSELSPRLPEEESLLRLLSPAVDPEQDGAPSPGVVAGVLAHVGSRPEAAPCCHTARVAAGHTS